MFWSQILKFLFYPDLLVRATNADPVLSSSKNSKKTFDSYCVVTSFDFLSVKNDINLPSKFASEGQKSSSAGFGAGSVSQRYGFEDPDLYQNIMDPEDCKNNNSVNTKKSADVDFIIV